MPSARSLLVSWGLAALAALTALVLLWRGPENRAPGGPALDLEGSIPGAPRSAFRPGSANPSAVPAERPSGPARREAPSPFRPLPSGADVLSGEVEVPAEAPLKVVTAPDRPARLRVVDGDGFPLSGARIEARAEGAPMLTPILTLSAVRTTTGPDGRAELKGLPGDESAAIQITATHRSRPPVRLSRKAGELRAGELSIVMQAGATLWGLVVGSTGEPEANVRLTLTPAHPDPQEPLSPPRTLHSTSAGAFRFTGLPIGEYLLHAEGGERGRRRIEGLKLEGEAGREVRVELAPPGSKEFEEAVPRAPAAVVRPLSSGGAPGTGTIRGRLRIDGPPPRFAIGLIPQGAPGGPPERVYQGSARRPEFSLPNVPAGTYQVLLLVDGKVRSRVESVRVEAGREAGPVELRLE